MTEQLRRTAVAGVVCNKEADNTADGQAERVRMLKEVRNGTFKVPELQTIHAVDAKLRDAIDATAPFVVLYFSSPREVVEPRVTLSVRDADSAPTLLADVVLRMDYFPKSLFEVVGAVINITKRNATIPSKIEEEVGKALLAFAIEPKYSAVILVAVNGEEPRKMSWSRLDEKIDAPPDEAVARVAIDFVVAALPAPGTRTPAQKFWLEPRAARLADECVAALVAGEPMPRDHLKKLHVMKDLGDDRVREDLSWIQFVGQLRAKRTAKKMKEMDAQRKDMFNVLIICSCRPCALRPRPAGAFWTSTTRHSTRARADALQMLVLKRLSLEASGGRALKDHVHDLVTYVMEGPSDETSHHPHVLAARLVFSYWIASGEPHRTEEGEPYRKVKIRGEPAVFYEDFLNEAGRRDIVALVLRADDYACAEYDTDGLRRARHTLADAAFLWTKRFDAAATRRYEVAAAAGNVLAGEIVKRLGSTDTATLSRKYKLDAFATRHLETLPPGLSRLGAVFDLASKNDAAARTPTPRADAAAAAAATESFAVDSAAAKTGTGKKKQQKAKKLREEKERKAKKKLEDERRRREAAAREEAERPAREAAARARPARPPRPPRPLKPRRARRPARAARARRRRGPRTDRRAVRGGVVRRGAAGRGDRAGRRRLDRRAVAARAPGGRRIRGRGRGGGRGGARGRRRARRRGRVAGPRAAALGRGHGRAAGRAGLAAATTRGRVHRVHGRRRRGRGQAPLARAGPPGAARAPPRDQRRRGRERRRPRSRDHEGRRPAVRGDGVGARRPGPIAAARGRPPRADVGGGVVPVDAGFATAGGPRVPLRRTGPPRRHRRPR